MLNRVAPNCSPAVLALICLAFSARAQDVKIPADKSSFHVFILDGQSNMAGSGHPVPPEYIQPNPRVLILGNDMKWSAYKVPTGGGMGPGPAFARHYAELHPEATVGLIQAARGARGLKELARGGKDRDGTPNYDKLIEKVKEAQKVGTITGILWHQGETDAGDQAYVEKLKIFVTDLRNDIGNQGTPFIAGELGRYATWTSGFNSRIPKAKTAIPHCAIASSDKLMDLGDKVHFSGFSCEVLGARYLMEYLTMKEPELAKKFAPALDKLTTQMLAKDEEWITVVNPSMNDGESRPVGWDGRWVAKGNLVAVRDTQEFAAGPAALRIDSVGGPANGSISTPLRNVCGKLLKISCKMKNSGFTACNLNLNGLDGSWKQALNQNVIDAKDAKDWTTLTAEFVVPANVGNCRLAIVVNGEGKAWLDEIVIDKGPAPETAPANTETGKTEITSGANLANNSSMELGEDKATGWTSVWTASGKLIPARDTKIFKTGAASLRIDSDGGPVKGSVSQGLKDVAGKTLLIKGWVKCQGPAMASAGVGAFDGSWKMLKWLHVFAKPGTEFDWTSFEQTVTIPADAVNVNLGLGIEGEGSLWFDDVEVTEVK